MPPLRSAGLSQSEAKARSTPCHKASVTQKMPRPQHYQAMTPLPYSVSPTNEDLAC